jgi:hypothetical protein
MIVPTATETHNRGYVWIAQDPLTTKEQGSVQLADAARTLRGACKCMVRRLTAREKLIDERWSAQMYSAF